MMTVLAGMGAVMAYMTPLVVGQQPSPLTAAFWGFGALGRPENDRQAVRAIERRHPGVR